MLYIVPYSCLLSHSLTVDSLLTYVRKTLGIQHIRTQLYSIPLSNVFLLFQEVPNISVTVTDSRSVLYAAAKPYKVANAK